MLDQLLNLVKENAGDAIINNPAIPNEHNDAAIETTSSSIFSTIQNAMASGGGLSGIMDLVKDGGAGIQGNVAGSLAEKFGIDSSQASNIAGSIVPNVLQGMVQKFSAGGFDVQNILSNLDANKDGKTDLGDLGGLADGLKGLFK